ncbi:PTS sugar transporter subunit IIA [Enterococcus pallens]|uniref:PTS system, glucose subfamily, IIA component n=1 Tax=Enterococcus pallens ATCC BAA-351 TaxID=1158607 RepID=R2Q4R8_9ENTE|nr:PTS glucose transporter subunit IIA [Enterococcus pallens]EOH90308.1 PTS system, glucose subfamily, IIA component [Enterococcus pallens ATCC BAA-351]EOU15086.1 hypothetical protein I588_04018 [Enterococcus pallens ATCC BAA-351]
MTELFSVGSGRLVNLSEVEDEVFSQKMLGDGYGLLTDDTKLYSPVSGTVSMVYDTGHALGIQAEDGTEILIHVGIDTVELDRSVFDPKVRPGDKVDQKTVLTVVNWQRIQENGYDATVLVVSLGKQVARLASSEWISQGVPVVKVLP